MEEKTLHETMIFNGISGLIFNHGTLRRATQQTLTLRATNGKQRNDGMLTNLN